VANRLQLSGVPSDLDSFLKPALRVTQLTVVLPAMVVLWWFGHLWWLPIPLVVSEIFLVMFLWHRGDRPSTLSLAPDGIEISDALREPVPALDPASITVATALWRTADGETRVSVGLADETGPQLALGFLFRDVPDLAQTDVDIDAVDRILGGQAGALRALAPLERVARQPFTDASGLSWLRAHVPPAAWGRVGARVWRGEAPALSSFGFHLQDATAWLLLDERGWALGGDETRRGALAPLRLCRRHRAVTMLVRTDDGPEEEESEVPLLGIVLADGPTVYFPAPLVDPDISLAPERPDDLHTHAAEGAALVHHLARVLPPADLPAALRLDTRKGA